MYQGLVKYAVKTICVNIQWNAVFW